MVKQLPVRTVETVSASIGGDIGATEALARFATGKLVSSTDHVEQVTNALIDTVAVAIAAAPAEGTQIVNAWAAAEGGGGKATVWTTGRKATASMAAMVNGTSGHMLDYDDISPTMPMHPSTVLFPALLAVAEDRGIDGAKLVQAYDVGAATFRAVTELLPGHVHYARGWHTTSTVGRLAAVAALARLCGTPLEQARNALGIVSSLAAGSRPNFGSMTKPFHAGVAARDAVIALQLADAGFTSNPGELEAPTGFLERMGDPDLAPIGGLTETLVERLEYWMESWPKDWGIKRYPACYGTHRAIDAVLELRDELAGRTPDSIRVTVHPRGMEPLLPYAPQNGNQAKFSLEYAVAVAIERGAVTLQDFTDDAFADREVRELMAIVEVVESPVPPMGDLVTREPYAAVQVRTGGEAWLGRRVDLTKGDARNPLSQAGLRNKFGDCCAAAGVSAVHSDRIFEELSVLPQGRSIAGFSKALQKTGTENPRKVEES
ncbi:MULTISPECIES: MmgE/PrpD family protein [unclassified Arthrobacter]|uniref:MmgE/PrpD family protein n=1 Tax=unclassified Arthrobacter TaxID=235627 RepID=UPI001C61498B|nr:MULTISPECIES: MmgE/PrpD family protein [unclassified Arthrobacter]